MQIQTQMPYDANTLPTDPQNWWLVMEGDWGGQLYLTVPLTRLGPKANPEQLLLELDKKAWECNEGDGTRMYLYSPSAMWKQMEADDDPDEEDPWSPEDAYCISGGMGGGFCHDGLWLHTEFAVNPDWNARARELLDL